jgi:HPt (histidine-containing phosphotransfer) domain-containing protein
MFFSELEGEEKNMDYMDDLKSLGVDVEDALKRFMNHSQLYEKMLAKFVISVQDLEVKEFLEAADYEKALANAHTLKGVAGNLSLTPLYKGYSEIVADLRGDEPEKAKKMIAQILPIQEQILNCIKKHSA